MIGGPTRVTPGELARRRLRYGHGYQVNRDIAFAQAPARVCAIPAAGGMWPSLLPAELAREALRPQAATGPGGALRPASP